MFGLGGLGGLGVRVRGVRVRVRVWVKTVVKVDKLGLVPSSTMMKM